MNDSTTPVVLLLPGVPGIDTLDPDLNATAYPDTASDFAKILQRYGVEVRFAVDRDTRVEIGHRAADIWLPIVSFIETASVSIVLNIISNVLYDRFMRRNRETADDESATIEQQPPILHVELDNLPDGTERLRLDGPADKVIEAIKELRRRIDDN